MAWDSIRPRSTAAILNKIAYRILSLLIVPSDIMALMRIGICLVNLENQPVHGRN